ncbi:MAG: bifunctional phosphoglucose/phosphomannose isomerase, partial [candidate division KSB1 bacterium]|nr:bifunctional phosphoglucose/phosphomannose isomerase [candidate division KSB1 bacterium]
ENSKVLAFYNVFPELNHNEIVGWDQIPQRLRDFQVVYLRDREDHVRNQKRMLITRAILERVTDPIIELYAEGESRLARLMSMVQLGDWVSYYLAILAGVDPTPIEKIQLLKDRLSRE